MEESKKTENATGTKENGGSKIPKPGRFSVVAKEMRSKTLVEKKMIQSSKTATKITKASSNMKQAQVTNLPKNLKRMSIAKISKDVLNHFQDENLKSDDQAIEFATGSKVLNNETAEKREPLKQKFSQVSQKQSGNLRKNPSAPDLKRRADFGGIRFTVKGNTCRKFDMFQTMAKESKDLQAVNHPEPCSKELKRTTSTKTFGSKEIEWSNERNLEDPSTFTTKSSTTKSCTKGLKRATSAKTIGSKEKEWSNSDLPTVTTVSSKTSVTVTEATLKKGTAFGGIRFAPKWQSTPLKPDLFENIQKGSKHDKELHPQDSTPIWLEKIPNSAKGDETITMDHTINIDETITLDETVQPTTKEPKQVKPASITMKEIGDKIFPAFAGMRLTPKRKSTHPTPDIFEKVQEESNPNGQESHPPGISSDEMKVSSGTTKEILKTEIQHSRVEMLRQTSTQKAQFKETVSLTAKETNSQVAAFGGIRFEPKWESTPIRPNMFESTQKESKRDRMESHPTDSSTKELKTIPTSIIPKIKDTQVSDNEKLALLKTQKLEPSKNDEAAKKVIPPAFGSLRFKSRQKNLHNVFEAQKS